MDKHGYRPEHPLVAGYIGCSNPGVRAEIRAILAAPTWDQVRLENYLAWKAAGRYTDFTTDFVHRDPRSMRTRQRRSPRGSVTT